MKYSPMIQQYLKIKKNHQDAILFFRLGDFYEMFFDDAILASSKLSITLTQKLAGNSQKIPMCGVPHHAATIYIEKLLKQGYNVVVAEQTDNIINGIVNREVKQVYTPGTYIADHNNENNYISAINFTNPLTLAYVDVATGESYIEKFKTLDDLSSSVLKLKIKEIVIFKNQKIDKDINKFFNFYNINVIEKENNNLLEYNLSPENTNQNDIQVISLLINYLKNNLKLEISHIKKFEIIQEQNYLNMNIQTVKNLELIKTIQDDEYIGTLFWYLNKTKTAMGQRLLKKWLLKPLMNQKKIENRQNYVEFFKNNYLFKEAVREDLNKIYDFERIIGKIINQNVTPKEIENLKKTINQLPKLQALFEANNFNFNIPVCKKLKLIFDQALNDELPYKLGDGLIFKKTWNQELAEVLYIKENINELLINYQIEQKNKTGIDKIKIKFNKIYGYFLEVPNSKLNLVPEYYESKGKLTNASRFKTDDLINLEEKILSAEFKLAKLENQLFNEVIQLIIENINELQQVSYLLAEIDVYQSLATVAINQNLVKPIFNKTNEINIKNGFHPIVKLNLKEEYTQNSLVMSHDTDIFIITGPNMSGKSTYMRQTGIIVIMAQIGSFVPAKECNIPIFDGIFTRIGSSDNIAMGESTFMVEMKEANYAIKNGTRNSLILFDEIGRGTSTYDGLAIAQSLIEYISQTLKSKTLFATHYRELCHLEKMPNVKNVFVKAEEVNGKMIFSHKVESGVASGSFGIQVANEAGMPNSIINRAEEILTDLERI